MIQKGKCLSIEKAGTFESDYGTLYKYLVQMESDDQRHEGEYASKSDDQKYFTVGETRWYEFVPGKYPKIKPKQDPGTQTQFNAGDDQTAKRITRAVAFKGAIEILLHNKSQPITPAEVKESTRRLEAWLYDTSDFGQAETKPADETPEPVDITDLPF